MEEPEEERDGRREERSGEVEEPEEERSREVEGSRVEGRLKRA